MEVLQMHIKEGLAGLKDLAEISEQVPIKITDEGLLIEVIDKDKQAFFDLSSAAVKPLMRKVLSAIVKEIKDSTNKVVISGHTDARPFKSEKYYSNWDLSTERALNTRRTLEELGLPSEQVEKVAGFADRQLRVANDPFSSENRRISILIRNLEKNEGKNKKVLP
jgi:chemotaxis protein MotB